MPDILLIQPPIEDFYFTAKRSLPYGLAGIAGALRQAGFSVALLDALATPKSRVLPWPDEMAHLHPFFGRSDRSPFALFHKWRHFGYSLEHIARQSKASGAFLIGISSLFSAYAETALATAAVVKAACPRALVVLGGHHPSALPGEVMRYPAVDYVLRGDGEVGLPPLARALRDGSELHSVPGLVRRRPDGSLHQNPTAFAADLNRLPMPAFDLLDWGFYRRADRSSAAISAGRGCPQRCTYCAVNTAGGHAYRCRSVAGVLAELEEIDRIAPLGFIDFEDEHLSLDRSWFIDLLTAIQHRFAQRRIELRAMNGLFAPSLDEELIGRMQQAGFKTLNLALITTSAAQLRRFQRPDLSQDVDRVLHLAGRRKMNAVVYLMVAGPGQDPYAGVADLLFLAQRRVLAGVSVFYPAPGSLDYEWCARHGLLPSAFRLMRATALPLAHITDRIQTVTLLRLGRVLNFMKHLLDAGIGLPVPDRPPAVLPAKVERLALGRILLAAFLHDGIIRGLDDEGRIYPHRIDTGLTRAFLDGLAGVQLKGASSAGSFLPPSR
ncbi:MAG: radical SAM protein [Desulfobacteraceae bacterium]|nr:MAG: radical SAM protein [Desulfobacteraceae bacterium]